MSAQQNVSVSDPVCFLYWISCQVCPGNVSQLIHSENERVFFFFFFSFLILSKMISLRAETAVNVVITQTLKILRYVRGFVTSFGAMVMFRDLST